MFNTFFNCAFVLVRVIFDTAVAVSIKFLNLSVMLEPFARTISLPGVYSPSIDVRRRFYPRIDSILFLEIEP